MFRQSPQEGFAFTQPRHLTGEAGTPEENLEIAEEFWRSQGFRRVGNTSWFAFAAKSTHPSHGLTAADDLRLERTQESALHKAAINFRVQVVKSILEKNPELASARNSEGYTPLQALEDTMEMVRYVYGGPVFSGFPQDCLSCLEMLRGDKFVELPAHLDVAFLSAVELKDDAVNKTLRAKFGCSCGQCIAGFLSPQVADALGELTVRCIKDQIGAEKCPLGPHCLPVPVLREPEVNKLMIRGFWEFCHLIGEVCNKDKKLPTVRNVMARFGAAKAKEPSDVVEKILHGYEYDMDHDLPMGPVMVAGMKEYLRNGGTINAAAAEVFSEAAKAAGIGFMVREDGPSWGWQGPVGMNDFDIDLVRKMCGYAG
ncbi:hypothetical protein QBC37DRAFT_459582 [Rhypophila decipiens]|uniref:Uncharacterized protein n=1 Tax=Rhypophila decipiens TaxID=261697 RepID=A0AAN6Y9H2_9PEZI|nr:hypothetical protein QBC37DRAFT_459582 [Rhypophila decipiens]